MKRWIAMVFAAGYILGISRGYVAVWRDEDPQPWLVTDMPASMLPEVDRQALEKGICLPDEIPLTKALEDYCS
ncbi:MAG TPA: hypothetical protein IAB92_04140 [Candidatus Faecousia faecigallinarum]|nr:hypothetical protein [Candidatus Faecousia faecigallinarum]